MVAYQDHQEAEMVVLLKVEAAAVEVWDLICQTESILSSVYLFFLILPFFLFFPFYGSECYDFPPPPSCSATCPIIHPSQNMRYLYNPFWSLGYLIVNLTVISFVNSCVEEDYKLWYLQVVSIVLVLFHLWKFHSTGGLTMKENCLAVNWFCWWPCAIMVCLKNVFHSIWDSFWCIATKLWCIEIHHFLVFGTGAANLS